MEGNQADENRLNALWAQYTTQGAIADLMKYLEYFIEYYKDVVDINFTRFHQSCEPAAPSLLELPSDLLIAIQADMEFYGDAASNFRLDVPMIRHTGKHLKALIVLAREIENIPLLASCDFVRQTILIATAVLSTLARENTENVDELTLFVAHALYFLECMYDPHIVWRKSLTGWRLDPAKLAGNPSYLHEQVIPFFYECNKHHSGLHVDLEIQTRLFHVFGAIISGCKPNALKAICPASVPLMLRVVSRCGEAASGKTSPGGGGGGITDAPIRQQLLDLNSLVLKCFVRVVHVLHTCRPEERQVEVGALLSDYFQVLLHMEHGSRTKPLQLKFLQSINEMLTCDNRQTLQEIFLKEGAFETLVAFLHKMTLSGIEAQTLAMSIISVMKAIMIGSTEAKELFQKKIGYSRFVEGLKKLGRPSKELLENVFDMIVEGGYRVGGQYPVANAAAALMLIEWLPDMFSASDLQVWTAENLRRLCCHSNHNRMQCCHHGMIKAILDVMKRHDRLDPVAVEHLLRLLEALGTLSITSAELTQFIQLLKADPNGEQHPYSVKLMHAMSVMARKDGKEGALHYINQPDDHHGIISKGVKKWPGYGMAFTAWMCLDEVPAIHRGEKIVRRQIYSFLSGSGNGFEAFFTSKGVLTVAVVVKKEYHTLSLPDHPITDNQWHCISISHAPAKRPFQSSILTVYIDGHKRLSSYLKFPPVADSFDDLKIGCPGVQETAKLHPLRSFTASSATTPASSTTTTTNTPSSNETSQRSHRFSLPGIGFLKNALPLKSTGSLTSLNSGGAGSLPLVTGRQDAEFGQAVGILGQLGSVALFCEALSDEQMRAINAAGPNNFGLFQMDDLSELQSKLVFRYNAKASLDNVCQDLSSNELHGQMYGEKCTTWDIKDIINSIGGVQVLFPLLEQVHVACPVSPLVQETLEPDTVSPQADWVVVPSSSYADSKLEKNQVAGFITLLRHMIQNSPVNQESLIRENAVATLANLLHRLDSSLLDINVLMAVQLLVDSVRPSNMLLMHHLYQYLLLDFRIWCNTQFPVRIGHIQYLSTIIKDDKTFFRKKYGVQYILDIIRLYYKSAHDSLSGLTAEEECMIRGSLFTLIKFYMGTEGTYAELNALLSFLFDVDDEPVVCEGLDLLQSLLRSSNASAKKDQIFLLLFEPEMGELLYMLLIKPDYGPALKEKVLKVIDMLLLTDKVTDKNKVQLRLAEKGMYPGLMCLIAEQSITMDMLGHMIEQVLNAESEDSANAMLSIIHLLSSADIDIKLFASRKLLASLYAKSASARHYASQLAWQEIIVRLLTVRSRYTPQVLRATSTAGEEGGAVLITATSEPNDVTAHLPKNNNDARTPPPDNVQVPDADDLIDTNALTLRKDELTLDLTGINNNSGGLNINNDNSASGDTLSERTNDNFSLTPNSLGPSYTKYFNDSDSFDVDLEGDVSVGDSAGSGAEGSGGAGEEDASITTKPSNATLGSNTSSTSLDNSPPSLTITGRLTLNASPEAGGGGGASRSSSDVRMLDLEQEGEEEENAMEPRSSDTELHEAYKRYGLQRDDDMDKSEELSQNVLIILFTILWKGVEGSDDESWKQRGQVFAAISYNGKSHELIKCPVELNRRLIELMLHGAITDLKETGQTIPSNMKNSTRLIKHVYNFLCLEEGRDSLKFNERIIEDVIILLELLTVWDNPMIEMEQFGLFIFLAFAGQEDSDLCSIATARLNTLLQSRPVEKLQESCFMMAHLDALLRRSVHAGSKQYDHLILVMKALLVKCRDMLDLATYLPKLPDTKKPSFYDNFKEYCQTNEWNTFIHQMIMPSKNQYESNIFDKVQVQMKSFMGDCHEDMMVALHKRSRNNGQSKLKFQEQIADTYKHKTKEERKRYRKFVMHVKHQHHSALRQWRSTKQFFTGDRGVWFDPSAPQEAPHWKLSNLENLSRMRPKLVFNYNFDTHLGASKQRDNEGMVEGAGGAAAGDIPLDLISNKARRQQDIGDDRLGDEEWNLISGGPSKEDEAGRGGKEGGKEKLVLSADCELITVMEVIKGRLEVTTTHVYFIDRRMNKEEGGSEDFKWALSQLREIHFRRYNLRRSALELFLIDQTNYFLNFKQRTRNKVYSQILSLRPPNLIYYGSRSPAELLKASGLSQKWINREISNFEYLMQLNTISGRTFNDLSQYPVFPWVLTDYTSDTLDLEDEKVYRDLSKPMGIVNPKNIEEVKEKYDNFEDPGGLIEKFHHGTHYSNAASVMHYLLRLEPYTTLHIELQSGRFDAADRQFHSLPASWKSLYDNSMDVKELIPEFFYLPEFLENMNRFDLGCLQQTAERIDDVILPKWANSPEDFINKHNKALESEYVSRHLHEWIDLIFGYKQKGAAAVEALNVFYYCTYEGAVDVDAIKNPMERTAVEGMINNFGQTPCQLLKEPHGARLTFEEAVARAEKSDRPLSLFMFLNRLKSFYVEASTEEHALAFICVPRNQARSFIQQGAPDTMIAISATGALGLHGWLPYDKSISSFFTFDKDTSVTATNAKNRKKLAGPFAPGQEVGPKLFAVTHDAKIIFSGGLWDNSIRVYSAARGKTVQNIVRHTDVVTCVALDHCGMFLMTGSRDTTCMIWQVNQQAGGACTGLVNRPLQILYGHSLPVTCVAITSELDMAVSGSEDGTLIVHTMRKGQYIRSLRPPCERGWSLSVQHLALSDTGQICCYTIQCAPATPHINKMDVHLYSINGKHLSMETVQAAVTQMLIASRHVVISNEKGTLTIKELQGLKTISTLPMHEAITCISITPNNTHILIGLKDGKLIIVGVARQNQLI